MRIFRREPAPPNTDTVLDFLYYDRERVASFLAQFHPSGYLQQITQGESRVDTAGTERTRLFDAGGRISPVRLDVGRKKIVGIQTGTTHSHVYDPLWANAVNFLNMIDGAKLLQRDLSGAGMGQIVQCFGDLELMDFGLIKDVWDQEDVKSALRSALAATGADKTEELLVNISVAKNFPHLIQGQMVTGGERVWFTLKPDGLSTPAGDLMLKHGVFVDGTWIMVGILDAKPEQEPRKPPPPLFGRELIMNSTLYAQFYLNVAPLMRGFLGRPVSFYGMTPLVIFRVIGGRVT
jgi:hypothetical protein